MFRGISADSTITRVEWMSDFVLQPFPFDQLTTLETDLMGSFLGNRNKLPPLRFDRGTNDPLLDGNRRLHSVLQAKAIPLEYVEFDGEHN